MAEEIVNPEVVLLGASSQIGLFAIPHLVAGGYRVYAVSRNPRPDDYPEFAGVDWVRPGQLRACAGSAAGLVSAGPLTLLIDSMASLPALSRVVVFSTSSVRYKLDSPDPAERSLIKSIADQEVELNRVGGERGLEICVLRPTLIYGCGMDENISRLAAWIRRFRCLPLAATASGYRQPVHADDLALAAVSALKLPERLPGELYLSGGSTVTYREMVHAIASGLGVGVRLVELPVPVLVRMVAALRHLPRFRGVNPAMVSRQGQDLVFDDSTARTLLGYEPRLFQPRPVDFQRPTANYLRNIVARAKRGDS